MYLIVGLGNPGPQFIKTYHNLGYMAIDKLADKLGAAFTRKKHSALFANAKLNGQRLLLIKPLTYMNLSGQSVHGFVRKQNIPTPNVIVFCDDYDLPLGEVRYKEHGSGGTHNGLRDIVTHIGPDFKRLKIGMKQEHKGELADYVLSRIDDESMKILNESIDRAVEKAVEIITKNCGD